MVPGIEPGVPMSQASVGPLDHVLACSLNLGVVGALFVQSTMVLQIVSKCQLF